MGKTKWSELPEELRSRQHLKRSELPSNFDVHSIPDYVGYSNDLDASGQEKRATYSDWARVHAMTDAGIEAAVADDPDAAPLLTKEELIKKGKWTPPRGRGV